MSSRKARTSCLLAMAVLAALAGGITSADEWRPPKQRECWSSERRFSLRVSPSGNAWEQPGNCLAELFRCDASGRRLVWRRYLVNDEAPVAVLVADSGKYVVTMDEWGRFGELPLVIYGPKGNLIEMHHLESIENPYGGKYDGVGPIVEAGLSGPNWRKHSLMFFGPDDETLFIRLGTARVRVMRLRDGTIMTEGWYSAEGQSGTQIPEKEWQSLMAFGKRRTPEAAVEYLGSPRADDRETGAIIVGELRIRKAIPKLRTLLSDDDAYFSGVGGTAAMYKVYFVRRAAADALRAMGENIGNIVIEEPGHKEKGSATGPIK